MPVTDKISFICQFLSTAADGSSLHVDEASVFITRSEYDHRNTYRDFRDYRSAVQRLQNASSAVERLIFDGTLFTAGEVADLSRHIASCCARTLTAIHLQNAGNFLVSETNGTFPRVERVHIEYDRVPDRLQLGRIYPAAEWMRFDVRTTFERQSLAALLLAMTAGPTQTEHANPNLRRVADALADVPRLRNLTVFGPANTVLPSIEANLRHLRQLSISYDPTLPANRTFHFGGVRELGLTLDKLAVNSTFFSIPLTFDRLETVALATQAYDDKIAEWIKQNAHIKAFSSHYPLFYDAMDKLTAALGHLPKLEDVRLLVIGGQNLADYLQHLGHVREVKFTLYGVDPEQMSKTIPADWRIVEDWHGSWDPQITLAPVRKTDFTNANHVTDILRSN